ncbi:hypothetical protein Tco_1492115 [Tanacetum coccineum]
MHTTTTTQLPNQFTTSQPHSEQQSHHLEAEDEDEPVPTPTSKPSRGVRLKSKEKKNKEKEPPLEKQKRIRNAWTQDEELLLAECFIQVSEDPKTGCDQKRDTFWYKIQNVYNTEAKKKGFTERTKNMLTVENDDDHMSRVHTLYDATVGGEFKHRSAWLFLKGKHKWTNPDSTLQRRNRLLGTDEEPEHFGDDDLPRPPGLQRLAKSQRTGSNSTASSGSNPTAYQEFMAEQYELDAKTKGPFSSDRE